ncbi:hypothetical protein [Corallincola spongiicola]|uniref:Uncharacterized protein n=1 Tax=Corallincola spongiicola TaxID=2520508 RepID=A0ABY1WLD1_9GAMM|nr:hypothetical protein [Corallincola spongiicola]TAA41706.1 hypothetical protein EXY25_15805 [Corallincola spongiicola]
MKKISEAIEAGKQRGHSGEYSIEGEEYYCSAAIQKYGFVYKAHLSIIKESDMAQEAFKECFTREFSCLKEAIRCIEESGPIKFSLFESLKGQKLFNPAFNEENET